MNNKKIGLYIRVSSEKQLEEGFSFQAQEEKLIDEAKREKSDYILYKDGGVTGKSMDQREGLKLLMRDVELGIIYKVYVTKISRLARNSRDLENLMYEFEKNNVFFKSIGDGIDTSTPMGNVMVKLLGIFAEMERDTIMEQTRSGAEKRAKEGKMYGSARVLGYDRVIDETSKKNTMKIVINPKEKQIIEAIYEMYLGGYGYKAITNKLNKEGFRTKNHKLFAINTVKTILDNPLYAGYIRYGKYKDWTKKRRKGLVTSPILVEGNHQEIISKENYGKVQEKMKLNQRRKPPAGKYMLAGVLTCPECGSKMVGSKTRYKKKNGEQVERLYYTCSQFHNNGLTACHSNGIRVDLIDPIAIKKIAKKLNSPELVDTLYKYIEENTLDENSIDGKRRIIEVEIEKQTTFKIELRKLYTEGIITASEFKEDIEKINQRTDEYQLLLSELDQEDSIQNSQSFDITIQDVKSFLSGISSTLKTDIDSQRLKVKELIRCMVSHIDVTNRNQATMDIHMSYDEMLYCLLNSPIESQSETL